ncbi:MAG: carbonic anhydrase [Candidatus Binatia bacterium]
MAWAALMAGSIFLAVAAVRFLWMGGLQPDAESAVDLHAAAPAAAPHAAVPAAGHEAHRPGVVYLSPEVSEHHQQSPINIVTSRVVDREHRIEFHYRTSREQVSNLGHTLQVKYDPGSTLEYDGVVHELVQFHFHTPSEHLLDGVTYPMEVHLVHRERGQPGRFVVIGVLFKEGKANPLVDTLVGDAPRAVGAVIYGDRPVDVGTILTPGMGYYHYSGSLTTPPYTETVRWMVLDRVLEASAEQIEALNRIEGDNARHIQDPHSRPVEHTKGSPAH